MQGTKLTRIKGDIFGGVTAAVVALPLALAFGVSSGAGAAAGLYGAIALGFFAAILGGTPTQISGPTGPMTVVAATVVAGFGGSLSAIILCFVLCGAFQVLFGLLRLGRYVRFIPYPVISGFMSGIGVIIILLQLHPLLGAPGVSSPLQSLAEIGRALDMANAWALGLAALTMAIVFLTPARVTRVLPSPLIALLAGTAIAMAMHLDVPTIGTIPSGLPELHIPWAPLPHLGRITTLALALALLGTIDTLLTSIVADSLTKTRHNPNRELMGQGAGNMICGLFGGLPGAGATMRTVVNIKAGGNSRVSGATHALILLAILLGLGPLASHIPMAVLAGILIKVGVDILDYRMLKICRRIPRHDLMVMVTVFAITVFVDLIVAVAAGVTLASLLLTQRIARQCRVDIAGHDETNGQARNVQELTQYAIRVVHISGPFFFGTSSSMQDTISKYVGAKVVVVDCLQVPFIDISAVFALSEMTEKLKDSGVTTILAVTPDHARQLAAVNFTRIIPQDHIHTDLPSALTQAQSIP